MSAAKRKELIVSLAKNTSAVETNWQALVSMHIVGGKLNDAMVAESRALFIQTFLAERKPKAFSTVDAWKEGTKGKTDRTSYRTASQASSAYWGSFNRAAKVLGVMESASRAAPEPEQTAKTAPTDKDIPPSGLADLHRLVEGLAVQGAALAAFQALGKLTAKQAKAIGEIAEAHARSVELGKAILDRLTK